MKKIVVSGEPEIVTEIRERISREFQDLRFDAVPHKYYLNDVELPSVSELTHRFCEKKDFDAIAAAYALKNGNDARYWLDRWKFNNLRATIGGSLVHEYGESLGWLRNGFPEFITDANKVKFIKEKNWLIPTCGKEAAILKFYEELPKNLHFVTAEARVYSGKSEVSAAPEPFAGTFDLLFYYDDTEHDGKNSGLFIFDWKTNKTLISEFNRSRTVSLLPPFNDMIEEPLSLYALQLSAYALCLRGIGCDVKGLRIVWLKDDGNYEIIRLKDLSKNPAFKQHL